MHVYTRDEAAEAAGVSLERLDLLIDLGIVVTDNPGRFTSGDVRRVAMAQSLEDAGIALDGLAAAIAGGELSLDFMDTAAYDRFSSLGRLTFQELSDEGGVPVDLLMAVREASGSASPAETDRVRTSEMEVVEFLEMQIAEGFQPTAVERLLRVTGDCMRRIAASEADWWQSEVIAPRLGAGKTMDEAINPDFTDRISDLAARSVMAIYRAQQAHAWTRNILDRFEQSLIEAGLHSRLDRPPAMCFLDIAGYTRLTQERGDAAAAELAAELATLVDRTSARFGGRPVKWLGDGVMFWFRDPGPAVMAALEMIDGVPAAGLPPAHVGVHAGPVVFQEGDYYGQTVNLASRIAEYARPGEVLVSQAVVDASSDIEASFEDIGSVELKGVGSQVQLYSVRRS